MLTDGYIRLHRSITGWEWYTDQNVKAVFLHLLLTVNYYDQKWQGEVIRRGQRAVALRDLSDELHLSVDQIRVALNKLERTKEITRTKIGKIGLITVENYEMYQGERENGGDENEKTQNVPRFESVENGLNSTVSGDWALSESQRNPNVIPRKSQRNPTEIPRNKESNKAIKQEVTPPIYPPLEAKTYGEFGLVRLTDDEYGKLAERLGKSSTADYIQRLDGWLAEGNRKKNHYATILNWWRKDAPEREKKAKIAAYDLDDFQNFLNQQALDEQQI